MNEVSVNNAGCDRKVFTKLGRQVLVLSMISRDVCKPRMADLNEPIAGNDSTLKHCPHAS